MLIFITSVAVAGLGGCSKDRIDPKLEKSILDKLGKIEERLDQMEVMLGGRREPDPKMTYAISLSGSPSEGPEHAKITIVEAFEFA